MQIKTVNVIKVKNNSVAEMVSFEDTPEGNAKAEEFFRDMIKNTISNWEDHTAEDIDAYVDDGFCSFGNGSICLTHSPMEE